MTLADVREFTAVDLHRSMCHSNVSWMMSREVCLTLAVSRAQ